MFSGIANYISSNVIPSSWSSHQVDVASRHDASGAALYAKSAVQRVQEEMQRRNNLGYGLGIALGKLFGTGEKSASVVNNTSFATVSAKLFPQKNLNVFCLTDPGVDDAMALMQFSAATQKSHRLPIGKSVTIGGVIPCVGNAVSSQTEQNTRELLELVNGTSVGVFPGARCPLAIENNTAAILKMAQEINATHFYGRDGLADVGGWPNTTMGVSPTVGYKKLSEAILQASSDKPITVVSMAALTELSKTLDDLMSIDPSGSFVQNIAAIVIRGGCVDNSIAGCNAPDDVPDDQKNSEMSFNFDVPAAANVFAICQLYAIPVVLLPLDLTQQPGLLWTKKQVSTLKKIPNPVAAQLAKVTDVIPYLFARHFPSATYPQHDHIAAGALMLPDFFTCSQEAVSIGDVGQVLINQTVSDSQKNVYILSMSEEAQGKYFDAMLAELDAFTFHPTMPLSTLLEIVIPAGVGGLALIVFMTVCIVRSRKKRLQEKNENTRLLRENEVAKKQLDAIANGTGLLFQLGGGVSSEEEV